MFFSQSIAWIGKIVITYYLKPPSFPISANLAVFCLSVTRLKTCGGRFCTQNRIKIVWKIACVNGPLGNHSAAPRVSQRYSCSSNIPRDPRGDITRKRVFYFLNINSSDCCAFPPKMFGVRKNTISKNYLNSKKLLSRAKELAQNVPLEVKCRKAVWFQERQAVWSY